MWWWAWYILENRIRGMLGNVVGIFFVGFGALVLSVYLGRQILLNSRGYRGSYSSTVLESSVSTSLASMDTGGEVADVGNGLLTLTQDSMVAFRKRNLFGFYDREPHHYYYLSDILKVKGYSDGFRTEVYYEAEDDEPAEVITYYYELKDGRDRWLRALAKPVKESPVPQQPSIKEIIREKETVREIVKIHCRNCDTRFDEKLDRCPHCGAPA
jgi:hypothetical protein